MNVSVHVERLILDGLPLAHAERPALQAAVQAELARLLTEGGLSPALRGGGTRPSLPAGGIELTPSSEPGQLGRQIARAVYGGLGR
jgi:hypothetical protein